MKSPNPCHFVTCQFQCRSSDTNVYMELQWCVTGAIHTVTGDSPGTHSTKSCNSKKVYLFNFGRVGTFHNIMWMLWVPYIPGQQ